MIQLPMIEVDHPSTIGLIQRNRCAICLQQCPSLHSVCKCDHQYCQMCCIQHINASIDELRPIKCLNQDCPQEFDQDCLSYQKASPIHKQRYEKQKALAYLQKHSHLRACVNQLCKGFVDTTMNQPFCSGCNRKYCKNCLSPIHQGPCQHNIDQTMHQLGFRKCGNCHAFVEKVYGCNYVNCKCGNFFCYLCGAPWKTDPCRFEFIKRTNTEIRNLLGEIRMSRVIQYNSITKWILAFFKIFALLLLFIVSGLVVPALIGLISLIMSLLVSPLYIIIMTFVRGASLRTKRCVVPSVIILYPVFSVLMTLLLIAFVISYFLFRHKRKQDMYKSIEEFLLNYVLGFLRCFRTVITI